MPDATPRRAVIAGSGPNGLAAAVRMAQAGVRVTVLEAAPEYGGGTRTAELTLPGFRHDLCSAVHPLAAGSPFFRSLALERYGLRWLEPPVQVAHPFDDGSALALRRSLAATASALGVDGRAYARLVGPPSGHWWRLAPAILGPILRPPRHPLLLAGFGLPSLLPSTALARFAFRDGRTRALFAGLAAHANLDLRAPLSASFGIVLAAAAHANGWPFPEGGAGRIAGALVACLRELGGEVLTGRRLASMADLPPCDAVLFDLTPRQLLEIAGERFEASYRHRLERFRYGHGVFKVDFALAGPIPWRAAECREAGTVHLGGDFEEVVETEAAVQHGEHPSRPFVIVSQPSLFDSTRAPAGRHTAWAYCHVPGGSSVDMTDRIQGQIERFAPGFAGLVLARRCWSPRRLEAEDANLIGGDINGGSSSGLQLFFRPGFGLDPYATSDPRLFICSASTPPGGGVHGMCGYHAALSCLGQVTRNK